MMRTLRPMAIAKKNNEANAEENLVTYMNNFCDSYSEILPMRTNFVQEVSQIVDADDFNEECFKQLNENLTLNAWFDPIDAIASVTQQEICDLHFKLYESLRDKQRTSVAEFVSFSYLASLDLFLNAHQQEDYENCVNMDVLEEPNQWVTNFVTQHPALLIWTPRAKTDIAAETADVIKNSCPDHQTCSQTGSCQGCDGCSTSIARIYKTFELYLNTEFANSFRTYSETMFNKLHEANLELEN